MAAAAAAAAAAAVAAVATEGSDQTDSPTVPGPCPPGPIVTLDGAAGTLLKLVHSTVDEELLGEAFLWPDSDEESAVLVGHGR